MVPDRLISRIDAFSLQFVIKRAGEQASGQRSERMSANGSEARWKDERVTRFDLASLFFSALFDRDKSVVAAVTSAEWTLMWDLDVGQAVGPSIRLVRSSSQVVRPLVLFARLIMVSKGLTLREAETMVRLHRRLLLVSGIQLGEMSDNCRS